MKRPHFILATALASLVVVARGAEPSALWSEQCAKCHGDDGKGQTKMGRKLGIADLSDPKVQAGFTDEQAFKAVKEGVTAKDGKVTMKPIEGLTEEQIKSLIPFVRALKK